MTQTLSDRDRLYLRLIIGAVFGLGLALTLPLMGPVDPKNLSFMNDLKRTVHPVLFTLAFVLWSCVGTMRTTRWLTWAFVIGVVLLIIHGHQTRAYPDKFEFLVLGGVAAFTYPLVFILNELVISADRANRPLAPYTIYFEEAWKRGVQLFLALGFTGAFWIILGLGAALLNMIGFDWLKDVISNRYFLWIASGLAMGAAVHLGDVQPKLLSAARSLALSVLSWLLPVMSLIGTIFVISLMFSGLDPLWKTKAATASLLGACVILVLLINAAYQQGEPERVMPRVLKESVRLGVLLLIVFSGLAAYALTLRISQYGLSPDRVVAMVGVLVALSYAICYGFAVISAFVSPPTRTLARLETANIGLAVFKCLVLLAILTPIADPARLSVSDQVGRLLKGQIKPDRFDWALLRYETGTYGRAALNELIKHPVHGGMALKAKGWSEEHRYSRTYHCEPQRPEAKLDPARLRRVGSDAQKPLPESLLLATFSPDVYGVPQICLMDQEEGAKDICYIAMLDLNGDTKPEALILYQATLFSLRSEDEKWTQITGPKFRLSPEQQAAFKDGKLKAVRPKWDEIMIGETLIYKPDLDLVNASAENKNED